MRKNKTKSILACAVLASVLAGGFFVSVVEAGQVNALVMPKNFGTLNGKNITFGQQRGYVENQQLTVITEAPTWQIVAGDNGSISLLANQAWGKNRFSDINIIWIENPGATAQQWYYREALQYLNENVFNFFSNEELNFLQNQTSVEQDTESNESKYSGKFALPTTGQVNALGEGNRKRDFAYWLADGYKDCFIGDYERSYGTYVYYQANTVQPDGRIILQEGENAKHIYPTIALNKPPLFAYYKNKTPNATFSSQYVAEPSTISLKNLTFKDTGKEKNVNITKLSVTQDKITFDAVGLATGEGQGIGGLVENAAGNYLAYARLADSDNGTAENVEIRFDTTITGSNTIHLFNEWLGDSYGLAGNYYEMYVTTDGSKNITAFNNKWDVTYDELVIGKGVNYTAEGTSNVTVEKKFVWENGNEDKLIDATIAEGGRFHLGGAFSVENPDDATITNRTLKLMKTGDVWNDMDLSNVNGTMGMNLDLNSLYMDKGKFIIAGNLTAGDYVQLKNNAELTVGGNLQAKRLEVNGTLKMTTADKTITVNKDLTASGEAKITGTGSDKLEIGGNLTAQGNLTLENITLSADNIQVAGGIKGDDNVNITAKDMQIKNMLSADNVTVDNLRIVCDTHDSGDLNVNTLTVKNCLDLADKKFLMSHIKNLNFGEGGKAVVYRFDLGVDYLIVSGAATGKVIPVTKYFKGLENKANHDVFLDSGDLSGLTIQDARVTDMENKQTYILTQDTSNKGKLNVTASKHKNVVMNFADVVKGQKIVLGNYWQENTDAKQPVLWSYVKQDNGQPIFLSEKILANTGEMTLSEMYKITNFLKADGAFVKDLFTASELAILNITNGDALGLPSFDDVKDGGNYGWNGDDRKAGYTNYAGNGGRNYALSSTHFYGANGYNAYINDWVDSQNGNIENSEDRKIDYYGIRPTISFDTAAVLFATNTEGGKGSCGVGNIIKLQDVESTSTLELTLDDAYVAEKAGEARKTGDVRVGLDKLEIGKDSIKTDYYSRNKNNSYLSVFIGDAALPQDIFGYGKLTQADPSGKGELTLNLSDFTTKFTPEECEDGFALSFVNEYGNGTSLVGEFFDYGKMYVQDSKVTLDLPVRNLPRYNLSVAKGNKLIVRGTGKEDIVSGDNHYLKINGQGTVAFDNVIFHNKNLSNGMDVEVKNATLRVEIDNRYENGTIVLKTADMVSLNSVKGIDGTNKIFLDIARMGIGFNETLWATNTSKTLLCLNATSNDVKFNFDGGYVVVGSEEMYEFENSSKKGEVTITKKKFGNGQFNDGDGGPFTSSWFKDYASSSLLGDFVCKAGDNAFRNFDLSGGAKNFTVNGNGHKFNGGVGANGIVITKPESSFTLKNISEISGFKDFAFKNGGTLNIIGETLLRGNILNYEIRLLTAAPALKAAPMQEIIGTTNIDGTLIVDTPITIENKLKFEDNSALKIIGSALNEGPAISGVDSLTVGENVALQFDPSGIRSLNGEYSLFDENVALDELNKLQFDKWNIENIGTVFDVNFGDGKLVLNWNPEMANFGENLGVSRGAYNVADMVETAVWSRTQDTKKNTVWATYIHNKDKVDGLELGMGAKAKYDDQYNGTIVGYDFSDHAGVALAYADGNTTNGYGGHNDGKHYGVSFYGKKQLGKAVLSGDFSYLHGKNELRQNINWENVEADADTNTYELSVHLEQSFNAGKGQITPYAGLRYMYINGKDYRNNLGVNYDADNANIFTGTLGVNYGITLEDKKSGWQITPNIETGYAFNFGDRNNDMTVGYKGARDCFEYGITDKGYFFLQGGLNFTKKNLTLGVGYDYAKSSNSHNNKWNVSMNWSF